MTITRERITGDYIKPITSQPTCPAPGATTSRPTCPALTRSCPTRTTRTRLTGDYVKPRFQSPCFETYRPEPSRSFFTSSDPTNNRPPVYTRTPVYTTIHHPVTPRTIVVQDTEDTVGKILIACAFTMIAVVCVAAIILGPRSPQVPFTSSIPSVPICHTEEVCQPHPYDFFSKICHLENVCVS